MKRFFSIVLFLALAAGLASAQTGRAGGNIGLGAVFGEPTGVSFKYWSSRTMAFDAAAAWSFVGGGSFQLHADVIFHNFELFKVEKGRLALYYGFGGRFKSEDENGDAVFSLRLPIGISYEFEKSPFELFFEVAPMLNLAPETKGDIGGGMGFRYYF